jgi:hypothetical protein
MRASHRRERGATLVEAAFAIPIFLLLVLGLVDFGNVGFNDNQAGNAARDGARVGIVRHLQADVAGSGDRQAIVAAIEGNLPGRSSTNGLTIEVACINSSGGVLAGGCASATIGRDRIRVRVAWDQPFVSPVANALGFRSARVTGESAMVIVGAPVAGSGPGFAACDVTSVTVAPNPVERVVSGPNAGQLVSDLGVEVVGTGGCANLVVTVAQGSTTVEICAGPSCLNVPLTMSASASNQWTSGAANVVVTGDDTGSGAFSIVDSSVCDVTEVLVTPSSVQRHVSGPNTGQLTESLFIEVKRTGSCVLTVRVIAPNGSSRVVCNSTTCLTTGYPASADSFWTAGAGTVEVTGDDTGTGTFSVTDAPAVCTVDVSVTPETVPSLPNEKGLSRSISIVVTPAGPCNGFDVTLRASSASPTYDYNVCSGAGSGGCTGTLTYRPPEETGSAKPWTPGTATVTVSGSANDTATFQVT